MMECGRQRVTAEANMIKVYSMHVWRSHNGVPYFLQLIEADKKEKKRKEKGFFLWKVLAPLTA